MFTFSFNCLQRLIKEKLVLREVIDILNLQGFEVKGINEVEDDKVVTIEVKANRPDMLYNMGVLREITAFNGKELPKARQPQIYVKNDNKSFNVDIEVEDCGICGRFSALIIRGIDNSSPTPDYVKKSLQALNINLINPVVDIVNYTMLELGQPMHAYDLNKISNTREIKVSKLKQEVSFTTLDGSEVKLPESCIVISDQERILCAAGIIGGVSSAIDASSHNILLESANFNEVDIRLASKTLRISTPSSFRFERGVDITNTLNTMLLCAEIITEACGGKIDMEYFDYYPCKKAENILPLSVTRANAILGVNLSQREIINNLEKYYFKCIPCDSDIINVVCPNYRLDLLREIDLIEEVARIYGYHNIEPTMPLIRASFNKNDLWENMNHIRNILVGLGFYEMINYAFIPYNSMEILKINNDCKLYSDILLENPISENYSLMRPTLLYSLISNVIYNCSKNSKDLALFEIGRTYFRNSSTDTKFGENDTLGIIFTGNRINRGWGISTDIKYCYYDIANYLDILLNEFGMEYDLIKNNILFFKEGTGIDVIVDNWNIGFCGMVDESILREIPNGKLIKDEVFYIEINIEYLKRNKKTIKFDSKYPPIVREYNLVVEKRLIAQDIILKMKSTSELIQNVTIKDIYEGKGISDGNHSILFQVTYLSNERTLTSEEITKIENIFLKDLNETMGAVLR